MPAALRERAAIHYEFLRPFCPEEITGLFVSEYINQESARIYESANFFSESFVMEAKNFATRDDLDMAFIQKPVKYWNLSKQDYDLKKGTDASRMYFLCRLKGSVTVELKASKENCDSLRDTIFEYFLPNPRRQ